MMPEIVCQQGRWVWAKEGGVREEILQDVSGAGRHIELFKDIDDLLKQNSLSSRPLDTSGGVDLFDIAQVAPTIIEMVGNAKRGEFRGFYSGVQVR
jgi:hypothetical protein